MRAMYTDRWLHRIVMLSVALVFLCCRASEAESATTKPAPADKSRNSVAVHPPDGPTWKLYVLNKGDRLSVDNSAGSATVTASDDLERQFVWKEKNGVEDSVTCEMSKRSKPWQGLTGLYIGNATSNSKNARLLVQEGRLYVDSLDDAQRWLDAVPSMDWAYSDEGIAVGIYFIPERREVYMEIVKVFIGGQPAKFKPRYSVRLERVGTSTTQSGSK